VASRFIEERGVGECTRGKNGGEQTGWDRGASKKKRIKQRSRVQNVTRDQERNERGLLEKAKYEIEGKGKVGAIVVDRKKRHVYAGRATSQQKQKHRPNEVAVGAKTAPARVPDPLRHDQPVANIKHHQGRDPDGRKTKTEQPFHPR